MAKQPRLNFIDFDDNDLDRLSEVTEQDITIAQNFITRHLDRRYQNLLLAQSQELLDEDANTT